MTRKRLEEKGKPKKSRKMRGLCNLHQKSSFKDLINDIHTDLVEELRKNEPNWYAGGKNIIPHLHWWNGNPEVDAGENRKTKGDYTNHVLSLCLCTTDEINERVGYPISRRTLKPWLEVKESGFNGGGLGLFAMKRFEKGDIIAIHFAPEKSRDCPKVTSHTFKRDGFYFSCSPDGPLYMGNHYVNDNTYDCEEKDIEKLERLNNSTLVGFTVTAKYGIEAGVEITAGYNPI